MLAETHLCTTCCRVLPVDWFRRRFQDSDVRHGQCRKCRNSADRDRRSRQRGKAIHRFASAITQARSDSEIRALCIFMIRNLGGVSAFAAKWAEELQLAMAAAPGSRRVLKSFESIVCLHQFSDEHETSTDDLTDSELEGVLHDEIKIVIALHPEFAVAALEQRGWTLIPPESDVSGDTVTGPKTGPTSSNFSWRRADERLPAKGEQGRVDPNGSG